MEYYIKLVDDWGKEVKIYTGGLLNRKFEIHHITESEDAVRELNYCGAFVNKFEEKDGKLNIEITFDYSEEKLFSKNTKDEN